MDAKNSPMQEWTPETCTETTLPVNFGNLDIPGHFNYLDSPTGTVSLTYTLTIECNIQGRLDWFRFAAIMFFSKI